MGIQSNEGGQEKTRSTLESIAVKLNKLTAEADEQTEAEEQKKAQEQANLDEITEEQVWFNLGTGTTSKDCKVPRLGKAPPPESIFEFHRVNDLCKQMLGEESKEGSDPNEFNKRTKIE
ncbi:hypothetical protein RclHR1_05870007 [Rhizophagus clarus]|uniref:Uncharacterized protein n=1 Tax=Rhizophagus clarus TaxID=94130 RepID=A0A2Z6RV97_9GLOM|nr:hypothetical protein RclHR1_05870007 [Rhizophagus clarus]GES84909.1 hypothetical protein RCL_jg16750.t1 [Rhizophagus clarus]